jgi:hypothetical protein
LCQIIPDLSTVVALLAHLLILTIPTFPELEQLFFKMRIAGRRRGRCKMSLTDSQNDALVGYLLRYYALRELLTADEEEVLKVLEGQGKSMAEAGEETEGGETER